MKILSIDFKRYVNRIYNNFSSIVQEVKKSRANPYEITAWIKKEGREKDILVYRVTATDKYVACFSALEIYSDDSILMNFSKEEIKYISTLAILIHYKHEPKYKIVWQNFRDNLSEQMIHLSNRDKSGIIKLKIEELEKNIELIDEMQGRDAYKLGKMMGINERILEEKIMNADSFDAVV